MFGRSGSLFFLCRWSPGRIFIDGVPTGQLLLQGFADGGLHCLWISVVVRDVSSNLDSREQALMIGFKVFFMDGPAIL